MIQTAIVMVILAGAVTFLVFRFVRRFSGRASCACASGGRTCGREVRGKNGEHRALKMVPLVQLGPPGTNRDTAAARR